MSDAPVHLGPGLVLTVEVPTNKPTLVPEQPARSALDRKVDQLDQTSTLGLSNATTRTTSGSRFESLEVHPYRAALHVLDSEDSDGGQAPTQEFAHARRV